MATTTSSKIVMEFTDEAEKTMSVTINHAKSDASDAAVKNLMDVMIVKADMFQRPPCAKKGAKMVTTTSTDIDVED